MDAVENGVSLANREQPDAEQEIVASCSDLWIVCEAFAGCLDIVEKLDCGVSILSRDVVGSWHGRRTIYGGRAAVRRAMFMAAKSAARWCPVLSIFYDRLRENGKSCKQALVAVARKLLVRINSLIKELERNPQFRPNQT